MEERSCATRLLKVARHLQRTRPDVVPEVEPLEGFATLLEGTDPSMKFVLRDVFGPAGVPAARWTPGSSVFRGTVVVARLAISTARGRFAVEPSDAEVARAYLEAVARPLSAYLQPYGPTEPFLSGRVVDLTVDLPRGIYNDSIVAGWVAGLVREHRLPPDRTAIVLLAPPGPLNTDADPGRGSIGYHAASAVPYVFANTARGPWAPDDPTDAFALSLSHATAEMIADPAAEIARPEVCDPCGPTGRVSVRAYFDGEGTFVGASADFPAKFAFARFLHAIAPPGASGDRPAPDAACLLPPPIPTSSRGSLSAR